MSDLVVTYFNVDPVFCYVKRNRENSLQDISPAHGFESGTTQCLRDEILFSYYDWYVMAGESGLRPCEECEPDLWPAVCPSQLSTL
jgi:hypothetical protein